ncbi:hypothetical protein Tco_0956362 [Tanacetum coccineum]
MGNSTDSFLDDALNDRLSDIGTLDVNRLKLKMSAHISHPVNINQWYHVSVHALSSSSVTKGTGYSLKDKNEAKPNKTESGIEKNVKN